MTPEDQLLDSLISQKKAALGISTQRGGTLAQRNNNPGNLRPIGGGGGFQIFSTPEEGRAALINDLRGKMTGRTRTGLHGESNLYDLFNVYAPIGDKGNDPIVYAQNVASHLGVSPSTKIGTLLSRVNEVADAISFQEGYYGADKAGKGSGAVSLTPPPPAPASEEERDADTLLDGLVKAKTKIETLNSVLQEDSQTPPSTPQEDKREVTFTPLEVTTKGESTSSSPQPPPSSPLPYDENAVERTSYLNKIQEGTYAVPVPFTYAGTQNPQLETYRKFLDDLATRTGITDEKQRISFVNRWASKMEAEGGRFLTLQSGKSLTDEEFRQIAASQPDKLKGTFPLLFSKAALPALYEDLHNEMQLSYRQKFIQHNSERIKDSYLPNLRRALIDVGQLDDTVIAKFQDLFNPEGAEERRNKVAMLDAAKVRSFETRSQKWDAVYAAAKSQGNSSKDAERIATEVLGYEKSGETNWDKVAEGTLSGIGNLPGIVLVNSAVPGSGAVSSAIGFGTYGAATSRDASAEGMARGFIANAPLGALLHGANEFSSLAISKGLPSLPTKFVVGGGIFGGASALEGARGSDLYSSIITGGLLNLGGGKEKEVEVKGANEAGRFIIPRSLAFDIDNARFRIATPEETLDSPKATDSHSSIIVDANTGRIFRDGAPTKWIVDEKNPLGIIPTEDVSPFIEQARRLDKALEKRPIEISNVNKELNEPPPSTISASPSIVESPSTPKKPKTSDFTQEEKQALKDLGYRDDEIQEGWVDLDKALSGYAWHQGEVQPVTEEVLSRAKRETINRIAERNDFITKLQELQASGVKEITTQKQASDIWGSDARQRGDINRLIEEERARQNSTRGWLEGMKRQAERWKQAQSAQERETTETAKAEVNAGIEPSLSALLNFARNSYASFKDISEFSRELISKLGEWVRPHLEELHQWASGKVSTISTSLREAIINLHKDERGVVHLTGTKNEIVDKERIEQDLSPIEKQAYTAIGDAYLLGKKAVESGEIDPRMLAEEVSSSPRPLSAIEIGALGHDRARLINARNDADNKISEAVKAADDSSLSLWKDRQKIIKSSLDLNDQALEKGGREQSAAFNARKMLISLDYTYEGVEKRMIAAKGDNLSFKDRARITWRTKEIADNDIKIEENEQKVEQAEANSKEKEAAKEKEKESPNSPQSPSTASDESRSTSTSLSPQKGVEGATDSTSLALSRTKLRPKERRAEQRAVKLEEQSRIAELIERRLKSLESQRDHLEEMVNKGTPFAKSTVKVSSPEIEDVISDIHDLQGMLAEMRAQANLFNVGMGEIDEAKQLKLIQAKERALVRQIAKANANLAMGGEEVNRPRPSDISSPTAKALKAELKNLREQISTRNKENVSLQLNREATRVRSLTEKAKNRAKELQEGIDRAKRGEQQLLKAPPKEGWRLALPDDPEIKQAKSELEKLHARNKELKNQLDQEVLRVESPGYFYGRRGLRGASELNGIQKLLETGIDASVMGTFGIKFLFSHPLKSTSILYRMIAGGALERLGENYLDEVKASPLYPTFEKMGLEFTDWRASDVSQHEEFFGQRALGKLGQLKVRDQSTLLRKVVAAILKGGSYPLVFSERSFTVGRNLITKGYAERFLEMYPDAVKSQKQLEALGFVANALSGRGDLGRLNQLAPELNLLMFAARYTAAAWQSLTAPISLSKKATALSRKAAARELGRFLFSVAAVSAAGQVAGLWVTHPNPTDAKFGQWQIIGKDGIPSETYINPLGNEQAIFRYVAQMAAGKTTKITTNQRTGKQFSEVTPLVGVDRLRQPTFNYIRTRLSPLPSMGVDYLVGKDVEGNKFTWQGAVTKRLTSMNIRDIVEAFNEQEKRGGSRTNEIGISVLSTLGFGTQTLQKQKK